MIRTFVITSAFVLGASLNAFAHSPLKTTIPANNADLKTAPETITLIFSKPARLTKVTLVQEVDGASKRLKLPTKKFAREFLLISSLKSSGSYQVNWRALGQDGHALKGTFNYTVKAD